MPDKEAPHDDSVEFRSELLRNVRLPGWTAELIDRDSNSYLVKGPCPTCHGAAWGPVALPEMKPVTDRNLFYLDRPARTVLAITAACRCGTPHRKDRKVDDEGCGRRWTVLVDADKSS